jgi:hypothetical protein
MNTLSSRRAATSPVVMQFVTASYIIAGECFMLHSLMFTDCLLRDPDTSLNLLLHRVMDVVRRESLIKVG